MNDDILALYRRVFWTSEKEKTPLEGASFIE